jgi:hypothetical protein
MGTVKLWCINPIELPHSLGQIPFNGFHYDVIVIIHQTIGMTNPTKSFTHRFKNIKPTATVIVIKINILATIASGGDMVQSTG